MKYLFALALFCSTTAVFAQDTVNLKTIDDSCSYAIGVSVASFYKQQGITNLNSDLIAKAVNDVLEGRPLVINDMQASSTIMNYMMKKEQEKSQPNIAAGEKFLAENKLKKGVQTTASGLQYEVLKEGTGIKPAASDTVVCHYKGMLLDSTVFDDSYRRGEPISIRADQVIKGWTEALQLMPVGSKYRVFIPYQLAYGPSDYGNIPGGSVLVFDMELLDVKKAR